MKTKLSIFKISLLIVALVLTSCSPEDGADGQIGPQGDTGVNGQDGNANVVSILLENQTISEGTNVFNITQLTQEIFDTGLVYAYVTVAGNNFWEVLPLSQAQLITLEIDKIEVGKVTLRSTFNQSNLRFRFVLVEGIDASGIDASGIDFKNYEEVQSYYNL